MTTAAPAATGPAPIAPLQARVLAGALLVVGWLVAAAWLYGDRLFAGLGAMPEAVAIVLGLVAGLVPFGLAAAMLSVRSGTERDLREAYAFSAIVPSIAAVGLLVFVVAPVFDWIVGAFTARSTIPVGRLAGWGGGGAAVMGIGLVLPLQFLGRGRGPLPRAAFVALAAGTPPTLLLASDGVAFGLAWPVAALLAAALVAAALVVTEIVRGALEAGQGLRPSLIDNVRSGEGNVSEIGRLYPRRGSECTVGMALSGGGYRASLFGLGALMYVHEACAADPAVRRVAAISSVSGGSVTNGLAAHALAVGTGSPAELDAMARRLIRHATRTGSMFSGEGASLAYWILLLGATLALVGAAWPWVRYLTPDIAWRAAALLAAGALAWLALDRALRPAGSGALRDALQTTAVFAVLFGSPIALLAVATLPPWRTAIAWIAATLLGPAAVAALWALRGPMIQRTFDALLRGGGPSPRLADAGTATHHVFCATEAQVGEPVYFARDRIRPLRRVRDVGPGRLPTASAVRASAAFPGAFPPFFLPGVDAHSREDVRGRAAKRWLRIEHMTLVDGGVHDNLGIGWFDIAPDLDQVVVVSAAANRHALRTVGRLAGIGELMALVNIANIPYNARERFRRRALRHEQLGRPWTRGAHAAAGALIHIEDSPYDLAWRLLARAGGGEPAGTWMDRSGLPEWDVDQWLAAERLWQSAGRFTSVLRQRAAAVLAHLDALERRLPAAPPMTSDEQISLYAATLNSPLGGQAPRGSDAQRAWWVRTRASTLVGTQLGRIPVRDALNLVLHGYCLAMATLHVVAGWPLRDALDAVRLARLFDGALDDPKAIERVRASLERAAALGRRRLEPFEALVALWQVNVRVREAGESNDHDVVVAVAVDAEGHLQVLGAASIPTWRDAGLGRQDDIQERRGAAKAMHAHFWNGMARHLRDRGLARIGVLLRSTQVRHSLLQDGLDALDAALRETWPDAQLQPRPIALVDEMVVWLSGTEATAARADLEGILAAEDAIDAERRLAAFGARWRDTRAELHDRLTKHWADVATLYGLTPRSRAFLASVDAELKDLGRRLQERSKPRGAADGRPLARATLLDDLAALLRTQPPRPDWAEALRRLTAEAAPARVPA